MLGASRKLKLLISQQANILQWEIFVVLLCFARSSFRLPEELLLVCNGGSHRAYFFENQKYTKFRKFLYPRSMLIASWNINTRGFIAVSATELQCFGKNFSLALVLSNFLISSPQFILIMYQIAYPEGILDNVLQTQKVSDPPIANL